MGTANLILPLAGACPPDGSASNAAAAIVRKQSSGSNPKPHWLEALFDATTEEHLSWSFVMPANYSSGLKVKVPYKMASATSGTFGINVRVAAVSDGDSTDVDAKSHGTVNTVTAVTVPGTAGYIDVIDSGVLSNLDSLAAGDRVTITISRDVANDTATGDAEVLDPILEYTTP
jgi:hypothetical protein